MTRMAMRLTHAQIMIFRLSIPDNNTTLILAKVPSQWLHSPMQARRVSNFIPPRSAELRLSILIIIGQGVVGYNRFSNSTIASFISSPPHPYMCNLYYFQYIAFSIFAQFTISIVIVSAIHIISNVFGPNFTGMDSSPSEVVFIPHSIAPLHHVHPILRF